LIGWEDSGNYGLDNVDPASTTYAEGSVEFMIRDEGGIWKEKKVDLIRADFEPLISGDEIGLQYKLDRSSLWTNQQITTTVGDVKLRVQMPNTRHQEYQVRLNVKTLAVTTPAILGVTVVEDVLTGEQYV
jgi:hypothetical protein